jgi:autotransporter-associated beta strand protein
MPSTAFVALAACLGLAPAAFSAGNDTWNGAGADANWGTALNWSAASANRPPLSGDTLFFDGSSQLNASNNFTSYTVAGLTFNPTAGAFVLTGNSLSSTAAIIDNSPNPESINLPLAFAATHSLTAASVASLQIGGVISGAGGITVGGPGLVTLTNASTYTGSTAVNAGTLTLDFNDGGLAKNIISAGSPLSLGGGALNLNGSSTLANTQTFGGATLASGASVISVAPASGATVPTLALGALTCDAGATVMFNGPATSTGASSTTGQSGAYGSGTTDGLVAATAKITTTAGTANQELTGNSTGVTAGSTTAQYAAFATVGLYDYAIVINTSPFTVIGASQGTAQTGTSGVGTDGTDGAYTLVNAGNIGGGTGSTGGPWDLVGNCSGHNTDSDTAIRFNAPGAATFTASGGTFSCGGVLVTPNVGANNITINAMAGGLRSTSNPGSVVLWQNNPAGWLVFSGAMTDGRTAGTAYVLTGPGTVQFTVPNTYTGPTYVNGGAVALMATNALGAPATAAAVTLNGGTIVASASFALDSAGADKRPVTLGNNGGGLAAAAGTTLTVDGVISGTGPLVIGLPADAANGETAALVPGTGGGSPNTEVDTTGTVLLDSTGNTFAGGAVINPGAILAINSQWQLGESSYGGLTFNGGTLQYAATLLNPTVDFSQNNVSPAVPEPVTFAGSAAIDVNGHTISVNNTIGNNGPGALIVLSSTAGGVLNLLGSNTFTGGVTVSNATLLVNNTNGSATGPGPVTVLSGGALGGNGGIAGATEIQSGGLLAPGNSAKAGTNTFGSLTLDYGSLANFYFSASANSLALVSASGVLSLNGGIVCLYQNGGALPFATPGTYNLFQAASLAGSVNLTVGNPQTGYTYTFGASGGYVTLTIAIPSNLDIGAWDQNANGNWSAPANWSAINGVMPPHQAGDSAIFGVSTAQRIVTLDANETVGGIVLTNPNSFTIATAGKTLTLDNSGNGASLLVTAGTLNLIPTALALNDTATVTVNSGASLTLSGPVSSVTSGAESLTFSGAGSLTLSGNNSYGPAAGSVGTTVTGPGTLAIGAANALANGDVNLTGSATLQAAAAGLNLGNALDLASAAVTLTVNNAGYALNLDGSINGAGALTLLGSGTVALNGDNSYSGNTTINTGVVSLSSSASLGNSPTLFLTFADLLATGTIGISPNLEIGAATGAVGNTASLDAAAGQSFTLSGSLASAGNTGTNNLVINSGAGNTGTVILAGSGSLSGSTVIDRGVLDLQNSAALQSSTLSYNNQGGTLLFDSSLSAATLGGLVGAQNLALTNLGSGPVALTVGNNSLNNRYSGSLNDAGLGGALIKVGSATLTLSGSNCLSGSLTVSGGTLELPAGGFLSGDSLGGGGFLVDGGTLTNADVTSTFAAESAIVETAGAINSPGATFRSSNDDGTLFAIYGGSFSAAAITLQRTYDNGTTPPTAAAPLAAVTTSGVYVDSTNTASPAKVSLGSLTIGTANSSASYRQDAGTVVVTNEVLLGDTSNIRVSILQVNGGTFTSLDTNNGLVLGEVNGTSSNNAELYLSGGVTFAQMIAFGTAADTSVGSAGFLIISGGTLYLGSLGFTNPDTSGLYTPLIALNSGLLGALGNLTITNNLLLGAANFTFQAADNNGVSQNINLTGTLTGTGGVVKTGAGTLTLNDSADAWTGATIVSNGVLALAGTTTLASNATTTVLSPGILSVSGRSDDTLTLGASSLAQTLEGNGSITGKVVLGADATLAPGAALAGTATLTASGSVTLGGTTLMNLNRANSPNSDRLVAPAITAGGILTVNNLGAALVGGDTFKLFSPPPTGKFTLTNLPALATGLIWSNTLAANGSLTVLQTINTNASPVSAIVTNNGAVLSLSWPADRLGWRLIMETNPLTVGYNPNTNDWTTVPGSTGFTSTNITINPALPTVFYRLVYP